MISSQSTGMNPTMIYRMHIDLPLLLGLLALMGFGLIIMYSATGQDIAMMEKQVIRIGLALLVMLTLAQISPRTYDTFAPFLYISGLILLIAVLFFGDKAKGAQRWLDLGFISFQPSELMKLAVPLMVARYINTRSIPPSFITLAVSFSFIIVPTVLIAKQPDLGTSILIAASGIFVVFLAGISWKIIATTFGIIASALPPFWLYIMRDYQKQRVLTLFNPELDPLGSGYHIIQSKIAIGSGGFSGKGWLKGTQSQLDFLPERHTDFIFSVIAEEWGIIGVIALFFLYLFIIGRGLILASYSQTSFGRLMIGSIVLSFFVYAFVNIAMVSGLLPVVGIPLPLVSYGGTSMLSIMAGFGILMSIHTHRLAFTKMV